MPAGEPKPRRPRIFLVDDHQLLLQGLALALEGQFDVVGTATTGGVVVASCRKLKPEAVVLDLSLPDRSGLEIIADLHAELPNVKILVVTMHADRIMADASLQTGAHGFLPKDSSIPELTAALLRVLAGERIVSERIPKADTTTATLADAALGLAQLTPRQRRIVHLISEGMRTADIAAEIGCSAATISFHRMGIRKALGLQSEFALLRYALLVRLSEQETS
ncbi:MAG TPA: response regulator transcription factor [Gemmatimonadales bacterium]|nr:response regulator transcription factor [Gemmatimonadales bacterium]